MEQTIDVTNLLAGQKIDTMHTIGSWWDNDCINVYDYEGNHYRMSVTTILQMVNEFAFTIEKKRKYTYLQTAIPLDEFSKEDQLKLINDK